MHALFHAANIRRAGAAAAADQARSFGIPGAGLLAEIRRCAAAAPLLGRGFIVLTRIRVCQQRLVGLVAHPPQQRADVLRLRAVDTDGDDLLFTVQRRGASADILTLAIMAAVLAGEADPRATGRE